MTIKFDYLLILIENSIFPYTHAVSVGVGHIIPLCVDILSREKTSYLDVFNLSVFLSCILKLYDSFATITITI